MFKCGYLSHGLFVSHTRGIKGDRDEILPCCYSEESSKYKLEKTLINEDPLNGNLLRAIRRDAIANTAPSICSKCVRKEQITGTSPRLQNYHFDDETVKEIITEEDVRYLHIRLSNVCNFQCTICVPNNSHLIGKEENVPNPLRIMNDSLFDMLKEKIPKMKNLHTVIFAGGEPFYNANRLIELLDYIPKQINIMFHTNGSLFNKKLLDKLYTFQNPSLSFSFDGSGRFFEYQRRNGNWDTVCNNIKQINKYYPRIKKMCNTTISCITLPNLYDFINETRSFFESRNFNFIIQPEYYRINILNDKALINIKIKMDNFFDNLELDENIKRTEHIIRIRKNINDNIDDALNNPASDNLIDQFWLRTEYLKLKGHDIKDYVPEIEKLIR